MQTIADLMGLWPSVSEFARDIGVQPTHAHVMKVRGSIPSARWAAVVEAAKTRGIPGVTFEKLAELAARRKAAA